MLVYLHYKYITVFTKPDLSHNVTQLEILIATPKLLSPYVLRTCMYIRKSISFHHGSLFDNIKEAMKQRLKSTYIGQNHV